MADFNIEATLSKLSLSNKIKLLSGSGRWHTEAIDEAGIPPMRFSDGPNGVRGTRVFNSVPSNCFPCSTGLGSSFDVDLAYKVGQALGDEARAKGCHVLLGPTVNTQRSPLGGRSFESFSEDPHLNGFIAAAFINGLQSKGVSATIKHFVANDQEFERFSMSSDVSERALREIYLKPFQIAIKHANPWAVMSSYNRVNGVHVSESKRLLDDILRKEWGYQGMIMSDWTGVYSTSESITAGLDLEMPGPTVMRGKAVGRALLAQKLFPDDIDARVKKIFGLLKHAHDSKIPFNGPEESLDTPAIRALLRNAAADAVVLLKNDKKLLPFTDRFKRIAVIGPNAKVAVTSGGGSARLRSAYTVSPLEGIAAAAKKIGAKIEYSIGTYPHKYLPLVNPYIHQHDGQPGLDMEFWNEAPSPDFCSPGPDFKLALLPTAWKTSTFGTDCFLADGIVEPLLDLLVPHPESVFFQDQSKVRFACWMRNTCSFIPDEDGDWEFELNLTGVGNLFLDEKLVVDLSTNPAKGDSFFGLGTTSVRNIVPGLKAGQEYKLEVRLSTEDFVARGPPVDCWGGFRLGAMRQVVPDHELSEAVELARISDAVIIVIGLNHDWERSGQDRADLELPGLTNRLVSEVLSANNNTVIINQSGAPVCMPWINEASTLLQAFYGGNELGNGLADVIFGHVNPSGKLPLTFPIRVEDVPSFPSFGNKVQEHGRVLYNEGIFVGYRGYEAKQLKPLFPFGFGLSYTTFKYTDLQISPVSKDGSFSVSFKLTNTGQCDGKETAQIYISDVDSSLPRPKKELKGFAKVTLKVGESKDVYIALTKEALGFYDERRMNWLAEKGLFKVLLASSSDNVVLSGQIELEETLFWTGLW